MPMLINVERGLENVERETKMFNVIVLKTKTVTKTFNCMMQQDEEKI